MQGKERGPIHLAIPFYRQHSDFTCGPASLIMAMKYFDFDLCHGVDLENDLWREGNLIEIYATGRYGLAFSAASRGFSVKIISNISRVDFVGNATTPVEGLNPQILEDHFRERRARCRRLGVKEREGAITDTLLYTSLRSNHVPLIVISTLYNSEDDLPHWVAVTGIDDKYMYFNDPSDLKKRKRKIALIDLRKFIGYHGDQYMVEIWKQ